MGGSPSCQIPAVNMKGPVAEMAFNDLGIPYEVYELDKQSEGSAVQDVLDHMTGQRTVPRVFVGGVCIGGGTEAKQLHKDGKLLDMVKQCQSAS
ncbi:Glutaredoxin-2-like [Homarus americanus]|uniref:Glutaredoxin-2-like n=1 Tax=Homarus americanus TaxID=6706 RepID=A0A8J5MLF0_HOMAM|nr:Glutaredoxin-2-like [Homarus americanus]